MSPKEECVQYIRPVRDTLEVLAGKWKVPILLALTPQGRRFNELERLLAGITARTLSKELKELEMNELVQRTVGATAPVAVAYSLTAHGRTLEEVIATLQGWGRRHRAQLLHHPESARAARPCPRAYGA